MDPAPTLLITPSQRTATWIALALAHGLALLLAVGGWPWSGLALACASHLLVLWGTLRPRSALLGAVANRFRTTASDVWLTIDDGPTADTEAVLSLLARHRARATFFLKGELAARHPERVRAILAAGHGVGNHSHTHPAAWFWALPPNAMSAQVDAAQRALSVLGPAPRLFRAVVGMANPFLAPALARRGLVRVGWSARGFDATTADPERVVQRILPDLRPGAIVLLHQGATHGRSVETIGRVLEAIAGRGYRCVIPALPATRPRRTSVDDVPAVGSR